MAPQYGAHTLDFFHKFVVCFNFSSKMQLKQGQAYYQ